VPVQPRAEEAGRILGLEYTPRSDEESSSSQKPMSRRATEAMNLIGRDSDVETLVGAAPPNWPVRTLVG